jgi:hypothetical protein
MRKKLVLIYTARRLGLANGSSDRSDPPEGRDLKNLQSIEEIHVVK